MKKIKLFLLFFCINFMLLSCGGEVGKIMRNEKIVSTDEFLIKKKGPLSQPPDFNTLPQPGSQINKQDKNSKWIFNYQITKKYFLLFFFTENKALCK